MDLYERLSRMMLRRKYARVEERCRGGVPIPPHPVPQLLAKSKSTRASRAENPRPPFERPPGSRRRAAATPAVVSERAGPRRFTLRSSNNDAIDGNWFNSALRRSVAAGRLDLGTIESIARRSQPATSNTCPRLIS